MLLFLSLAAQGKKIDNLSVVHSNYFSLSLFLLFFPRHCILLQKTISQVSISERQPLSIS